MQDMDLFLSLAEIAGVFVGFGALIAVRGGGATSVSEIAYMRGVVSMGVLAVIAALAPVVLDRYHLAVHDGLAVSSVVTLVGWGALFVSMARTPEYRANWAAELEREAASRSTAVIGSAVLALYMAATLAGPIAVVAGVLPDLEIGLYSSGVVLILVGAAWTLLYLVFSRRGTSLG